MYMGKTGTHFPPLFRQKASIYLKDGNLSRSSGHSKISLSNIVNILMILIVFWALGDSWLKLIKGVCDQLAFSEAYIETTVRR
jgi:hypothetical protein